MARDQLLMEALEAGGVTRSSRPQLRRRRPEERLQQAPRPLPPVRTRRGPAIIAHEAARRTVVDERPRADRTAAAGAAVERRIQAVQLEQPRLEVTREQGDGPALGTRADDGDGQPVHRVL